APAEQASAAAPAEAPAAPAPAAAAPAAAAPAPAAPAGAPAAAQSTPLKVPDIGDFKDVAVTEILVKVGDTVTAEQSLFTVESDKASMEIPSPAAGVIKALTLKVGDTVNIGDLVGEMEGKAAAGAPAPAESAPAAAAPAPVAGAAAA